MVKKYLASEFDFKLKKINKKPLLIVLFVLLNIGVIAATAIAELDRSKDAAEFSDVIIDWKLLLPAALCFVAAIVIEIGKYVTMIKEMSKNHTKYNAKKTWKVAARTVLLGKYYDNITPAAVGGQPFQIYYMRKNSGLEKGDSTSIPVFGMITGQIGFLIIAPLCFIFGAKLINNTALLMTAWFGLLFFAFWPAVVACATFLPKQTTTIIKWIVKFLAKIKIVKNQDLAVKKTETEINGYVKSVKAIIKAPKIPFLTVFYSICFNILIASIPFFVLKAFGGDAGYWTCFVTTIAVMAAVYFIPTPGNAGAAEGTFFLVFSALSTGYVFWAMLVWRFFSYYIYIIMGPIIYSRMHFENKKKRNG
jgi:uncharacterized protein (TIRG00374 family)